MEQKVETREIKFEAWNTAQQIMFSAEGMSIDQLTLLPTGSFINVSSVSTRLSIIYPNDKMIPLQFTDFRDKDNVEVYDFDLYEREGVTWKVYFDTIAFQWRICANGDKQYDKTSCVSWLRNSKFRRIGNEWEQKIRT